VVLAYAEETPSKILLGERDRKLFFATQVSSRPPTILTFWNHPRSVNLTYHRYLLNQIRKEFLFEGTNIRLFVRKRTEKSHREMHVG